MPARRLSIPAWMSAVTTLGAGSDGRAAARLTVHRMRKRYRQFLLQQIASTLDPDESAEEELRYLFGVFQT